MDTNQFLNIIDATPLVSIDLIVETSNGKYLLGKRNNRPAQGFWFVPGGRIRKNETLAHAFKRISLVELGIELDITQAQLLGAYDHIYDDNFNAKEGINTHYVALGYKIIIPDNIEIKTDSQHSGIDWLSENELLKNDLVHHNTKRYFL
ncbi:GDP-mannose mannosyl hydrolase [Algibacillus agarilyticus]|uniref:GDP-mannose mannosyl hydrolase n=1 Tax=Algibacillus agarilyticus TaxID=2234133 RepID=UPI000DCFA5EE|nr:GDP-mannose mannosyl hydrolase [Algibacillus agarilyticus]